MYRVKLLSSRLNKRMYIFTYSNVLRRAGFLFFPSWINNRSYIASLWDPSKCPPPMNKSYQGTLQGIWPFVWNFYKSCPTVFANMWMQTTPTERSMAQSHRPNQPTGTHQISHKLLVTEGLQKNPVCCNCTNTCLCRLPEQHTFITL